MDTIADSDSADMGSIPVRGIFLAKIGLIVFKNVFLPGPVPNCPGKIIPLRRLFCNYSISHFLITIDFAKYLLYNMGIGGKCHETD